MSDEKLDRIEDLVTQLIKNVAGLRADTNSRLEKLETKLDEVLTSNARIEHRLNVMERKQAKMADRVDTLEVEVDILQEGKQ